MKVIRGRPLTIWGGGGGKIENEFIFSAAMPFEIYIPDMHLQKKIFSIFFLQPHPQIINGRPLRGPKIKLILLKYYMW